MSLSIPGAPNAGLFKQGYQKSVPRDDGQLLLFVERGPLKADKTTATTQKMER